jgi:large subunit ribosomal protein L11
VQTIKTPPVTYFIKKTAGLESGSQRPGHTSAGVISCKHIYEIAKVKQTDDTDIPLRSLCKAIIGTCKSMGIRVVRTPELAEA